MARKMNPKAAQYLRLVFDPEFASLNSGRRWICANYAARYRTRRQWRATERRRGYGLGDVKS